jgi:hypothetical protein
MRFFDVDTWAHRCSDKPLKRSTQLMSAAAFLLLMSRQDHPEADQPFSSNKMLPEVTSRTTTYRFRRPNQVALA